MTSETAISFGLVVFGYLLGSVSPSVYLGKIFKKIDLREHGSGNAGTTNAFRVLGVKLGIGVFLLDMAKGFLPVFLARTHTNPTTTVLVAAAAMAGHTWPVFLRFRGGKGVATASGAILAMSPLVFGSLVAAYFAVFFVTRVPSAGSLAATLVYPTLTIALGQPRSYIVFSVVAAAMVVWLHRGNIARIVRGKEPKAELPWKRAARARAGPRGAKATSKGSGDV